MDDFLAKQNVLSQDFRIDKPGASKISSKRFDNLKDLCKKENCLLKMKSSNLSSLPPKTDLLNILQQKSSLHNLIQKLEETWNCTPVMKLFLVLQTNVIVSTVSTNLDLSKGFLSQAIFKKAGPALQTQLHQASRASTTKKRVIDTSASGSNLDCEEVYFTFLPNWKKESPEATEVIIETFSGHKSIAFPALGTGNLGYPVHLSATFMLREVLQFNNEQLPVSLKDVHFVLFPKNQQVFKHKGLYSNPQRIDIATTKRIKVEIICGDITKETTDAIVNSTNSALNLNTGVSKAILEAAGKSVVDECKAKGQQPADGVVVTGAGNISCKHIIHTVGQTHPAKITSCVLAVLQESENLKLSSLSLPAFGTGVGKLSAAAVADAMMDAIKQHTPHSLLQIRIVVFHFEFQITFSHCKDNGSKALHSPNSKCPFLLCLSVPETWTDMKGSTYMKVPLSATSQEYADVKNNFMKSAQAAFKVLKIERIQNTKLWEGYLLREKNVEKSTKPSVRTLFHGTTVDVCDQIVNHGFDRNYSGKNATAYGKGTYFAVNSSYSANKTYSPLDSKGQQHIIQARVATGDFHIGNQNMVAPPPKSGQSELYDSLVDNVNNPTIFVIFRDDQAYPEYVISFSL
uniref:Poly [ADP-ribose] polymerase n=1 Tax=Eptatretus burgeri TaxID=7764 RepID=A0A8C4NK42_EPTBU